jgi:hypothetical protein
MSGETVAKAPKAARAAAAITGSSSAGGVAWGRNMRTAP